MTSKDPLATLKWCEQGLDKINEKARNRRESKRRRLEELHASRKLRREREKKTGTNSKVPQIWLAKAREVARMLSCRGTRPVNVHQVDIEFPADDEWRLAATMTLFKDHPEWKKGIPVDVKNRLGYKRRVFEFHYVGPPIDSQGHYIVRDDLPNAITK